MTAPTAGGTVWVHGHGAAQEAHVSKVHPDGTLDVYLYANLPSGATPILTRLPWRDEGDDIPEADCWCEAEGESAVAEVAAPEPEPVEQPPLFTEPDAASADTEVIE